MMIKALPSHVFNTARLENDKMIKQMITARLKYDQDDKTDDQIRLLDKKNTLEMQAPGPSASVGRVAH